VPGPETADAISDATSTDDQGNYTVRRRKAQKKEG